MSDKPTADLIAAINSYRGTFAEDKRFSSVLETLTAVRDDVAKLDPVADRDVNREQVGRDGRPTGTARDGQPDEKTSFAESNGPPLRDAAQKARQIFRGARKASREAASEPDSGK